MKLSSLTKQIRGFCRLQRKKDKGGHLPFLFCIDSASSPMGAGDSVGRRTSGKHLCGLNYMIASGSEKSDFQDEDEEVERLKVEIR